MTDDCSRLDALRALLAQHEPTPDDARGGHTYRFEEPSDKVRIGRVETRRIKFANHCRRGA